MQQVLDDADLVRHLGAAQDRHEGPLGIFQSLAHNGQFLADQEARHRWQISRHAGSRRMGPVYGAKSVGYIDLRQGCQLLGKFRIVLLLFLMEAQVLQQENLAIL